jgi:hypothetical protein
VASIGGGAGSVCSGKAFARNAWYSFTPITTQPPEWGGVCAKVPCPYVPSRKSDNTEHKVRTNQRNFDDFELLGFFMMEILTADNNEAVSPWHRWLDFYSRLPEGSPARFGQNQAAQISKNENRRGKTIPQYRRRKHGGIGEAFGENGEPAAEW